jgi:hypothetical protein
MREILLISAGLLLLFGCMAPEQTDSVRWIDKKESGNEQKSDDVVHDEYVDSEISDDFQNESAMENEGQEINITTEEGFESVETPIYTDPQADLAPKPEDIVSGDDSDSKLIRSVISSYDWDDPSSFDNVNLLLDVDPEDVFPLLDSGYPLYEWTALYVLSNNAYLADESTQDDVLEKIRPYLICSNPDLRLMAAITVNSMENKEGVPVLIDLLNDNSLFMLSEPPMLICQYSNYELTRFTSQDFGFSCSQDNIETDSILLWEQWYQENSENLVWVDERWIEE